MNALLPAAIPADGWVPVKADPQRLSAALAAVDQHSIVRCYKVGVLYARRGQTTEEEMLNNDHAGARMSGLHARVGGR